MSETNTQEQLAALLAQFGGNQAAALAGFQAQPSAEPTGISLPVSIESPMGKLRVYFHFPGNFAKPEALMGLISQLAAMGVPLDTYGGGFGGGFNRGGGYGGNGGGYGGNGGGGYSGGYGNRSGGFNRGGRY